MGGIEDKPAYSCIQCVSPRKSKGGAEGCTLCEQGYFWDGSDCARCPQGAQCDGGEYLPYPLPGHWVDPTDPSYLFLKHLECPLGGEVCLGGEPSCFKSEAHLAECYDGTKTKAPHFEGDTAIKCLDGSEGILW